MKKINKSYILLFAVIFLLASFLFCSFFIKNNYKKGNNQVIQKEPDYSVQNIDNNYNLFTDKKYKYSFQVPKNLKLDVSNNEKIKIADSVGGGEFIINRSISFSNISDGYGLIGVAIYDNTRLKSLAEWVVEQNNFLKKVNGRNTVSIVIEKTIKIGDVNAIVTYQQSKDELGPYDYEKTTVFIKDGKLFELSTRVADHEKVWGSFKFID